MNTQNPARSCGNCAVKNCLGLAGKLFNWKITERVHVNRVWRGLNPPRALDTAQVPVLTLDALQGRDMGLLSVLLSSDNRLGPAGNINGAAQLGK